MRDGLSTFLIVLAGFAGVVCLGSFLVFFDDSGGDFGGYAFVTFGVSAVVAFFSYMGAEHYNPANGGSRMNKGKTFCSACGKKRRWGQSCSCGRPASLSE